MASEHAISTHPAMVDLGRLTVAQMLAWLPHLAAEVVATAGSAGSQETARAGVPASRPPASLAALDALTADDGREFLDAPIRHLLTASRLCWEVVSDEVKRAHPQPSVAHVISEARWLAGLWPQAQAVLDLAAFDWVTDEVRAATRGLAIAAGVAPPPRLVCPDCRGELRASAGEWLTCADCARQVAGSRRVVAAWRCHAPMTTAEVAERLDVSRPTLMRWQAAGKIAPVDGERPCRWDPWEILRLRHPDIIEALDPSTGAC